MRVSDAAAPRYQPASVRSTRCNSGTADTEIKRLEAVEFFVHLQAQFGGTRDEGRAGMLRAQGEEFVQGRGLEENGARPAPT